MDRSRSSPDDQMLAHRPKIPAASTTVVSRRASGSAQPRNSPQAESSDTSMEDRGRDRQRVQPGPGPSSSSSYRPSNPIDLSASQASFLAGAAVTHARQATQIANNAADAALSSQLELQHAQALPQPSMRVPSNSKPTLLRLPRHFESRPLVPFSFSRRKLGLPLPLIITFSCCN